METRFTVWTETQVETRDNKSPTITGFASVFWNGEPDTEYRTSQCVERIMPTAFDNALRSNQNIMCYFNHNPEMVLGSTDSGTLTLSKENRGLKFSVPVLENDPDSVRAKAKIDNKLMQGASFGFSVAKDGQEFRYEGETLVRYIHDVNLHEVSPVYNPAYGKSSVAVRSVDGEKELNFQIQQWKTDEIIKKLHR